VSYTAGIRRPELPKVTPRVSTPRVHLASSTMSQAPAQYKKQDGIISLSEQGARAVLWKSNSGALPTVTIPVTDITSTCVTLFNTTKDHDHSEARY
jgi:hypothetical protein